MDRPQTLAEWKAESRKTLFPSSPQWEEEWQHITLHLEKFPDFLQKQIYAFDKLLARLEAEENRIFNLYREFHDPDLEVLLNYYFWLRCSILQPVGLVLTVVLSPTDTQTYTFPRQGPLTKPSDIETLFLAAEHLHGMECRDAAVARDLASYKSTLCSPQRAAAKCEALMDGYPDRLRRAEEALTRPNALYHSFRAWKAGSLPPAAQQFKLTYSMASSAWRPAELSVEVLELVERDLKRRVAAANEEWTAFFEVNLYTRLLHPVLLHLAEEREDEEIAEEEERQKKQEKEMQGNEEAEEVEGEADSENARRAKTLKHRRVVIPPR